MKLALTSIFLIATLAVAAQATFRITSGTKVVTDFGAQMNLNNADFVNDGIFQQTQTNNSLIFSGSQPAIIAGTNGAIVDNLEIQKSAATTVTLQQSLHALSYVSLRTGWLDLNRNNITLEPGAQVDEREESHIIGPAGGYIEITETMNAPSSGNLGGLGAAITTNKDLGKVTIRRGHVSQTNSAGGGKSILRYYDIIPENNADLDATLEIYYFESELNGIDENTLSLWKKPDGGGWSEVGFDARDTRLNYVRKASIHGFSRWTLAQAMGPLPVQLSKFIARCEGATALLEWTTSGEQNSSHFVVERSADAVYWRRIAQVAAAGNSADERKYSFMDMDAPGGTGYYRIALADQDGSTAYSKIQRTGCGMDDHVRFWPNPAASRIFVSLKSDVASTAQIGIHDNKGALVKKLERTLSANVNQFSIDINSLTPGLYQVRIVWNSGTTTKIVSVMKQ